MSNTVNQPFVSILTPVYNGEKFLEQCIESVLNQTYENWEYVIVNNCSTDHSLEIAEKYAKQDERISIHNNEQFLELMPNLNHAFRQIAKESEYCQVVHADDWLFPECVERRVEVGVENPDVGIVSSYYLKEPRFELGSLPYPGHNISGREICRRILMEDFYPFGSPSTLLIRSDMIRKQDKMYDESYLAGDFAAPFKILKETNFGFVHQILLFQRMHDESATKTIKKDSFRLGNLKVLLKHGPDFLSDEEMDVQVRRYLDEYYRFLARNFYSLQPRAFWEFHFSELETLGFPVRYPKLARLILAKWLNPRSTLGRLKQSFMGKYA